MAPVFSTLMGALFNGDCLTVLRGLGDGAINCCVTSPPYFGLRDYGTEGQIGLEETPDEYVQRLVEVFREVRRVLRDDGTLWLNLGDSYNAAGRVGQGTRVGCKQGSNRASNAGADNCRPSVAGLKEKDLIGIPWRVAFALQADGWYLRQDIVWHKPNPMPESVRDRCTKAHEYIFLLSKSPKYYYDSEAVKEPAICGAKGSEFHTGKTGDHQLGRAQKVRPSVSKGGFKAKGEPLPGYLPFRAVTDYRNRRSVWTVTPKPYKEAHFATYPPDLIEPCILAGCPEYGMVLDPFMGSGTTALVAERNNRCWIGAELNPEYCTLVANRLAGGAA